MRIGIFSTFIEAAALDLVRAVQRAVSTGEIPNTQIVFIFSNRELGENNVTDEILKNLGKEETPLITFSATKFDPQIRKEARIKERQGDSSLIADWRNRFGMEILRRITQTDIDLLLGDMYIWGESLGGQRNGVNLHPALPDGPKGKWYNVIWHLIATRSKETGVMMHKVTRELDRGPTVTFCRFPIEGPHFDPLWQKLPTDQQELSELIKQEITKREMSDHPLHREIRRRGLAREFPLIIQTVKAFAEGQIRLEGESVLNQQGEKIEGGYEFTKQIDAIVRPILKGKKLPERK